MASEQSGERTWSEGTGKRRRVAESAAEQLRGAILRGEVEPGTQLPAERTLAERLGVSRLSLRAAIARLEAEGLLQPMHGSGTRVLDYRERGGPELIVHLLRLELRAGRLPLSLLTDVLELRRMLAVQVLQLAAERRTPEDLVALRAALEEVRAAVGEPDRFMQADLRLARLLVRATHNLAVELVFNPFAGLLEQARPFAPLFAASAEQAAGVYARLLQLIEARQSERVARVGARLLERLDRHTLEVLEQRQGARQEEV